MVRKFSYLILFILILFSCKSPKSDLQKDLKDIVGKEVVIPDGLVPINFSDSISSSSFKNSYKYIIVAYIDSMTCSECKLKKLFPWNDLFFYFYKKGVPVYIIFNMQEFGKLIKLSNILELKFL